MTLIKNLQVTEFKSVTSNSHKTVEIDWEELCAQVENPKKRKFKTSLPLIKMATFGDVLSPKGFIRHDENVLEIYGVECDYDGEEVSIEDAAQMLEKRGIEAILYSSPQYTPESPRWRVLAPLSEARAPELRQEYTAMINAALGNILAKESFALSQVYYFGQATEFSEHYKSIRVHGEPIDLKEGQWDPIYYRSKDPLEDPLSGACYDIDAPMDEKIQECIDSIYANEGYYQQSMRLAALYFNTGLSIADSKEAVRKIFRDHPNPRPDIGKYYDDISGFLSGRAFQIEEARRVELSKVCLDHIFEKFEARQREIDAAKKPIDSLILDLNDLFTQKIHPHEFIIKNWLPRGAVTLFAGNGGIGKSWIALQIAIDAAAGANIFGESIGRPQRVVYLSGEDSGSTLLFRAQRYIQSKGLDAELISQNLRLVDWSKKDIQLLSQLKGDQLEMNEQFNEVRDLCRDFESDLLVLDNSSILFGGNEINRGHVQRFISAIASIRADMAALLLHHVDKASLSSGSSDAFSGSTGWHNAARARWSLGKESIGIVLGLRKSNYGKAGFESLVTFNDTHIHYEVADPIIQDKHASTIQHFILEAIAQSEALGNYLSANPKARSDRGNAKAWILKSPGFPQDVKPETIWSAIENLMSEGMLRVAERLNDQRKKSEYLSVTDLGMVIVDELRQ